MRKYLVKILQVHNYYKQSGGEDVVVENEKELLESRGHEVLLFSAQNKDISTNRILDSFLLFIRTIYNFQTLKKFKMVLDNFKPDIIHVHNTFPLIFLLFYII